MSADPARSYADLTTVDRAILRELENVHGEGSVLSGDLASVIGIPARSMGGRLASLHKRGLIEAQPVLDWLDRPTSRKAWTITTTGMEGGPW